MSQYLRLLTICFTIALLGCSETIDCPGDYTITNAAEMEAIDICDTIEGDLDIVSTSLTDLFGLASLTEIEGCLRIRGNDGIEDLYGLDGLRRVGECLVVEHNDLLHNLNDLSKLTSIGTNLRIISNSSLADLSGLNKVRVTGSLVIKNNVSLSECKALSLRDQLRGQGYLGDADIGGNDTSQSCE